MQNSNIEWCHHTFNHVIGCSKVSPGCKNCYAEADMDNRRKRVTWGVNGTRSVTAYSYWRQPLKWERDAQEAKERHRVFCASLADVFEKWDGNILDSKGNVLYWPEDPWHPISVLDVQNTPTFAHQTTQHEGFVPLTMDILRAQLFLMIERTSHLDWLLLTKRPENVMSMVPQHWKKKFPSNVWMGTSVENQEMADERIPILRTIPASIKFLSCEPLLEKISIINIYEKVFGFKDNISGSTRGAIENTTERRDMENWPESNIQNNSKIFNSPMQPKESGTRHGGISNDSGNVQQNQASCRGPQTGILPLQGENTKKEDDKSRGRQQEKQSPGQLNSNDGESTGNTCNEDIKKRTIKSVGHEEQYVEIDRDAGKGNNSKEKSGGEVGSDSQRLQNKISTRIKVGEGRKMATHFWVICGGESGNKKRPFDIDWARHLQKECEILGISFFMKQVDKVQPIPEDLLIRQLPK